MSTPKPSSHPSEFEVASLVELLQMQGPEMQQLFKRAINLYAGPGADGQNDREKADRLRAAVEKSMEVVKP